MKTYFFTSALLVLCLGLSSAQSTFTYGGAGPKDWNISGDWSAGIPASTSNNGIIAKDVFLSSGETYTAGTGNITLNSGVGLDVQSGSTLYVGVSGTAKNLEALNNNTITVAGTLYIYGDLVVDNSLSLTITGTMKVFGNITFV